MNALERFRAGNLLDAIAAASEEVRAVPDDTRRRTFLFELLCFAGEFARAEKQLDVLALGGKQAALGVMTYRAVLKAEQRRTRFFEQKEYLCQPPAPTGVSGSLNGTRFAMISDTDARIGARLEVLLAGDYVWIPFVHIESIQMEPPRRLRDLVWMRAVIKTGPGFPMRDLGEVFVPALSPLSWKRSEDTVRLGRETIWELADDDEELPFGQKIWVVDDHEFPFLDLRSLEFQQPSAAFFGQ